MLLDHEGSVFVQTWKSYVNTAWRIVTSVVTFCVIFGLVASYLSPLSHDLVSPPSLSLSSAQTQHIRAPYANLWKELSGEELEDLVKFLHSKPNRMNLTGNANDTLWVSCYGVVR